MNRDDAILELQDRYRTSGRDFNELQRRRWAAMAAMKLGRGGITLVSKALRISPNTIKAGIQEISSGQIEPVSAMTMRIRKPGGGRKSKKSPAETLAQTVSSDLSTEQHPVLSDSIEFIENGSGESPEQDLASEIQP